ncbi:MULTISPECIES: hypothetical protein [unclassified Methanosarcina]|uniref:hypothetical protein n=1 Tax=unclassified Methanosarcina TaxID=2644672 RepID=UPI00064FC121|nr:MULTISPECIES: hypothetical protein [unclassified Methanosarcina]
MSTSGRKAIPITTRKEQQDGDTSHCCNDVEDCTGGKHDAQEEPANHTCAAQPVRCISGKVASKLFVRNGPPPGIGPEHQGWIARLS